MRPQRAGPLQPADAVGYDLFGMQDFLKHSGLHRQRLPKKVSTLVESTVVQLFEIQWHLIRQKLLRVT